MTAPVPPDDAPGAGAPEPLRLPTWEEQGRSPVAAALLALFGIGVLYFNGQSLFLFIGLAVSESFRPDGGGEGYFMHFAMETEGAKNALRAAVLLSQYLLMFAPTLWVVRRWHTNDVGAYVRFAPAKMNEVVLAVLCAMFLVPLNMILQNILLRWLGVPDFLLNMNRSLLASTSWYELVLVVIVIAVTPAICEETFFRGYVQRTFERTMGWKSILLTGAIFGLFHFQPLGVFSLSMLGFLFGYFFYRSQSLVPAMAAHFTNNFLVVLYLYLDPAEWERAIASGVSMITVAALFISLEVAALAMYHRVSGRKEVVLS